MTTEQATQPTANKPSVLSLTIKERAALYAAYMPFIQGGGLFIPTDKPFTIGQEVFLLLNLVKEPNRLKVQGHVVWQTTRAHANKPVGIGVQFSSENGGQEAMSKIESILGSALKSSRPTHTM